MRHCFSLLVILCLSFPALCQTAARKSATVPDKPVIDSAAIADWSDLLWSEPSITSNGKYFMYPIENLPVGSRTLVVQSTQGAWKREFVGANEGIFSFDSKYAIFQSSDTLFFLSLGTGKQECVTGVSSFTYPKTKMDIASSSSGKLIAYTLESNNTVILRDLVNGKEFTVDNVADFLLSENGKNLLVKKQNKETLIETLAWIDLASKRETVIWSNKESKKNTSIRSYKFDDESTQAVFLTQDKGDNKSNIIWYYRQGMQEAEIKVSNELLKRNDGMLISGKAPSFSKNGNYIFFTIQRPVEPLPKTDPKAVQVDVWNYKDLVLQHMQLYYKSRNEEVPLDVVRAEFVNSINIENNEVRQLENESELIYGGSYVNGEVVITVPDQKIGDKRLVDRKLVYHETTLKNGEKKYLTTGVNVSFFQSPNKRFLVFFDSEVKHYMSYDFVTGTIKNISEGISVKLTWDKMDELKSPNPCSADLAGWLDNGKLLIYDNYDIWMLDPSGNQVPKNLTNGYGRANNIKFDLIPDKGSPDERAIYPTNKPLLLTGFWVNTKQNGFFRLDISKKEDPELLSIHSSIFYVSSTQTDGSCESTYKAKADNAEVWIVKKQTMADAPNFYLTRDLKSFKQLTNIQPQTKYRWATSELMTWKMPDGKDCQGILYKPEGFDASKKYPVIVNYYEKKSGGLHEFLRPGLIAGDLNVPWFTSRGYLVFRPDIHYTVGSPTKSVLKSVVPGVQELLKLPFVDAFAIGIQGHSFGGFETNILITETNLFAAAAEGAGPSDLISMFGSLLPTESAGGQASEHLERGAQMRMPGPVWGSQDAYIENSPIFKADKVMTPLLITHNKEDEAVPWGQAVELFIALRRLDKPVWMLQYDKGGHGVVGAKDEMDHTIRMTQYFDHLLKGAPAPKWITQGIPATHKGIATGYELDPHGSCSNSCKVCKKWNEQYTRTPGMFSMPTENWHLDKDLQ